MKDKSMLERSMNYKKKYEKIKCKLTEQLMVKKASANIVCFASIHDFQAKQT